MKKQSKRLLSLILTVMFSFTLLVGTGNFNDVKASGISKANLKKIVQNELNKKVENKLKSLQTTKKDTSFNENESLKKSDPNDVVRIIVQLKDKPAIKNSKNKEDIIKSQNNVKKKINSLTGGKERKSFGYLVNGFSMDVKRSEVKKIENLPEVKCVTYARVYYPDMTFAKKLTQTYGVWQELGYKGEGMVVSIVDTGVDYTHKDMKISDSSKAKLTKTKVDVLDGKGKFYTEKVPYGYNYADENDNIIDSGVGDMHGMHVAGIVAANGDEKDLSSYKAVKGVAPEAQILGMKVFSNNPTRKGAFDDDVIAAIEDSVLHGADIINMSLGSDSGFQDENDPEQLAIKNATDKGVLVVISAGNSAISSTDSGWNAPQTNLLGTVDTAMVGAPGVTKDSLCVASFENTNKICSVMNYDSDDESGKINYLHGCGEEVKDLSEGKELVECGLGEVEDFKGKNLNGKVALIQRGKCTFATKVNNAKEHGAVGVIVYNKDGVNEPIAMGGLDGLTIPAVGIGNEDGKKLIALIDKSVKISFSGALSSDNNVLESDMSPFTSWGPTPNLAFKPEISGIGGNVYSTANDNKYQMMSGTSMSSPYVAGSEALIVEALKKKKLGLSGRELVEFAKKTVINTAKEAKDKNFGDGKIPYSPRRQGSGLVQIKDAINNNVLITDDNKNAAVSLKEIGKVKTFNLNLKNYGEKDVTYALENGGVLSERYEDNKGHFADYAIPNAKMTFDKNEVTVSAKAQATVKVTITLPKNFDSEQFVEGYVNFKSKDSKVPSLHVPYIGFYGSWSKPDIIDKPFWNNSSILGMTGLTTNLDGKKDSNGKPIYLGKNLFSGEVNPEEATISPNDDGNYDIVQPYLSFLRNAKNIKVDIVDKNDGSENVLRNVFTEDKVTKDFIDMQEGDGGVKFYRAGTWDGLVYNSKTGDLEVAKEGKYYVRITTKVDLENAKPQIMYMPVKVDTTAPTINITSSKSADQDGNYTLTWTQKDDKSGLETDLNTVLINGNSVDSPITYDSKTGVYSCKFKLNENGVNNIVVGAYDKALNIGMGTIAVNTPVFFDNLSDGMKLNSYDLNKEGNYEVSGRVYEKVKTLIINGKQTKVNADLTFKATLKLKEGKNTVNVVAVDEDGRTIKLKESYDVYLDTKAPTVNITSPKLDEEERVIAKSNVVTIEGNIKDTQSEFKDCELIVNGKVLEENQYNPSTGEFSFNIPVTGSVWVALQAKDAAGNVSEAKWIDIVSEDLKSPFEITFDNLNGLKIVDQDKVKNDNYKITGTVNHMPKVFKINGKDVDIKNLEFVYDTKLKQGANKFLVYAEDLDGTVVYNYVYQVVYDSKKPIMEVNEPIVQADGKVYTNKDTVKFSGTVEDNTYGYTLYINGNCILGQHNYPAVSKNKSNFEHEVKVKNGDIVTLDLVDELSNSVESKYNIVVDKKAPVAPSISTDIKDVTNKNVLVTIKGKESDIQKVEYSFDNKNWTTYKKALELKANATVYARATDFAGNVSKTSKVEVNNIDKIAPVVDVKGVEEGKTYENKVTPIIAVDDKSAVLTYTLDGKEYKNEEITLAGKHTLVVIAKDKAGNETKVTVNFNIKLVLDNDSPKEDIEVINKAINSSKEDVVVETKENTNLDKSIFDNLKGNDKNITFKVDSKDKNIEEFTWIFNGKDIIKSTKNIDLQLNEFPENKEAIEKIDASALAISFKNNGVLPGKAKILFKSKWLNGKEKVYLYYYNPISKAVELIKNDKSEDGSFKVDKGAVSIFITHCSDYILSTKSDLEDKQKSNNQIINTKNTKHKDINTADSSNIAEKTTINKTTTDKNQKTTTDKKIKLPKTGTVIDNSMLLFIGVLVIIIGALAIMFSRKRNKRIN